MRLRAPLSRVRATPGFRVAVCVLICLGGRLAPPFLLAAALHELGHLAALRLLGIPVRGLELTASGAVLRAELRGTLRETWAVLAGPAVNLALALCFRRLWPVFALCNAIQLAANLLPVPGLDGGRACAMILPALLGRAGAWVCAGLGWAVVLGAVFLGVYGTCCLRLGLLPVLAAGFFLLRLPWDLPNRAGADIIERQNPSNCEENQ